MKRDGTAWYRFIAWLVRTVIFRMTGGVSTIGIKNVPMDGPLLVAPLHVSNLDPPLVGSTCPRALRFMAKKELFVFPLGVLIRSLGAFPLDREGGDTAAIRLAISELKAGRAVLIFPEGTRGNGQTMGNIQGGISMLAKRSGAQVLPVGLAGTHIVWPKGQKALRRAKMTVVFGEPFTYADIEAQSDGDPRKAFADELTKRIQQATIAGGLPIKTASETSSPPLESHPGTETGDSPLPPV
ncbi:MAG: 1-acyl-sn-glycerol-3-phosphate acyltransferase [Armatimonadetes bacterium]|nr:1-acyl-sn-glycerol-3-phosphate acyltransferase [Armatimonadota bacterium]